MSSLRHFLLIAIIFISITACSQEAAPKLVSYDVITSGNQQLDAYLPLLIGKKIGIVANHASLIGNVHLVDTLLKQGINIVKIFSPEHGFRGTADAGELISDKMDPGTGISILSLYGKYKKPPPSELEEVDVLVFDLQDVGVRFFTYISTLTYIMEACAEHDIPLIVLDRPNPNGFYIDGPLMEKGFESFIGMHKIPVVYGMTVGEFALMVNGEEWLNDSVSCDLTIIPLKDYQHNYIVDLPIKPSPNLPNWQAVYLYPSLCLFEGTIMSVGRGTDFPFQVYGHPDYMIGSFVFTPETKPGASQPKYKGIHCYGQNLIGYADSFLEATPQLNLTWLIESYKSLSHNREFFTSYFDKLAGTDQLRKQIMDGTTEEDIRKSWEIDLNAFQKIRKKYLLYE